VPTCFLLDDARMMWDRGGAMFPEYWITMAITPNSIQLGANRRRSGEAGSEKMPQGNTLFCGISSDAHL
jgi:hypothetical protein